MSGLLSDAELAALKPWLDLCGYHDVGITTSCTCPPGDVRNALAALLGHIDALQAERDRLRAEKLHHAETLGYINVKPVNGDTQLLTHDDDGTLFPTLDAAKDALYGPRWQVAAVLPLDAFHQDPQ